MKTTRRNEIQLSHEIVDNPRLDALYEKPKTDLDNPRSAYMRELRAAVLADLKPMFVAHARFIVQFDAHEYPSTHVADVIVRA